MGLSLQHPLRYADKEEDMLDKIVTEDESWVYHYKLESKRASVQWKHPSSRSTITFKVTHELGRLWYCVFDSLRVLLSHS
jgi:hypothetical protein